MTDATLAARLEKVFRDAVALCDAERLTGAALVRDGDALDVMSHGFTTAQAADGSPVPRLAARGSAMGVSLQGGKVAAVVAGKAAPGMARAIHAALRDRLEAGLLVVPDDMDAGVVPAVFELVRASHPIPDAGSIDAAKKALALAASLGPDDMLLCGISGGTSALLAAPVEGLSLADKMATTRMLLRSGAPIDAVNAVRKHLSRIKGGRLAAATKASTLALLLSDVAGDPPDVIGSGPASPDPSTYADALAALDRYQLRESIPSAARSHLEAGAAGQVAESPKADDPAFGRARAVVLAGPEHLRAAAVSLCAAAGFAGAGTEKPGAGMDVEHLATHIGHTAHTSRERMKVKPGSKAHAFVWVREPSVVVTGEGKGGRNGHLALLVARAIAGMPGVCFLSAGSDGIDGNSAAAGAVVDGTTWNRALSEGLDPAAALASFDSATVHEKLGTAIVTGRTGTNFMDLQLLAVSG